MLTIRLNSETEKELEKRSSAMGISKSELVRLSLKEYLHQNDKPTPWELGKEVFGSFDSGDPSLSQNKREKLTELIQAKKG